MIRHPFSPKDDGAEGYIIRRTSAFENNLCQEIFTCSLEYHNF